MSDIKSGSYTGDIDSRSPLTNVIKNTFNAVNAVVKRQQLLTETAQRNDISREDVEDFLYENYQDKKSKEYLVDGAILTCTGSKKEIDTIYDNEYQDCSESDETIGEEVDVSLYAKKVLRRLVVTENPDAEVTGLKHATIKDCEKEKNIYCFGNCMWHPDNDEEIQKFKNHTEFERKEGSCKHLMNLESQWDNYDIGQSFLDFPDDDSVKKPGITMTSILFCKHGGFIYPITSGQIAQMEQLYLIYEAEAEAVTSGKSTDNIKAGNLVLYNFSTFLKRSAITDISSFNYHIVNHDNAYVDENGLVRISRVDGIKDANDFYCVAMAPGFAEEAKKYCTPPAQEGNINAGYKLQVQLEDSKSNIYTMDVIIADIKSSSDSNDFYTHNHLVEFFVEQKPGENISTGGNVSFDKLLGGKDLEITKVYAYENGAMMEGNYNGEKGNWKDRK